MPPRARPLPELARALLASADEGLLDASLDVVAGPRIDPDARAVLEGIHEAGEARTLRELLEGDALEAWLARHGTERDAEALELQLARWLGRGQLGDDDPARLAVVPELPDELEGLLAWARPFDLLGELSRPAVEVLPDVRGLDPDRSLVECCLGVDGRGARPLAVARARDEARAHLAREAAAHAALPARAVLWKRPPAPALRGLCERLRAVIAGMELATLHTVRFVPAHRASVDPSTGVARARLHGGDGEAHVGARLLLSGHEDRAITGECERCARPGCLHVAALAARLVDACVDETDRLHAPLLELVRVPSWRRFVHALAAPRASVAPTGDALAFRLRVEGDEVRVGAFVRKARSGGGLSAGALVAPQKVPRTVALTEADRAVLAAMVRIDRPLRAAWVTADLEVLRALVEHPAVALEGDDEPVRVLEERPHVALVEAPGGLLPEVSLGGAKLTAGRPPRGASALVRHDPARGALVFAPLVPAVGRLLAAMADFRGVLPPESFPAIAPFVASLERVARVTAPKALSGIERPPPRTLLLRIRPALDEGVEVALLARALPMSPLYPPGQGPERVHGLDDGVPVFTRRDLPSERDLADRLVAALGLEAHLRLEPYAHRIEGTQAALELLSSAARHADDLEIEWAERAARSTIATTLRASDLAIALFRKDEWFRLEGGARRADVDLAVARLLDAARQGERFVRIEGNDYAELERDLYERLRDAQLCLGDGRDALVPAVSAPYLLDRLGPSVTAGDADARAFVEALRRAPSSREHEVAERPHLRPYQRDGVAWILARSRFAPGVCLADEMGLGKTVQAIAVLEARAALGPALVVAPTSVTRNWIDELGRFAPSLDARLHRGPTRRDALAGLGAGSVVVTSYDLLLRDDERFARVRFATQIVDEAQMVKNARTERARVTRSIDAGFRLALSGTPVENRLGDLWSLFHLLAPSLLGSWARFRGRFAVPIERYGDDARAVALRALVSPFILRRTKDEVALELPARTEIIHAVELSPAEQELYDSATRRARRAIGRQRRDDPERNVKLLAELTRLRQLACHPRLVVDDARLESSKLHALMRLLDDVLPRGHRVLVFSQFTRHLDLVREALEAAGITHLGLEGSTPAAERAARVARFQAGEAAVFLISLKAGGTGLNLTAADYVVHLDPWWNPTAEDQASDRAHRIGQERPVTIVKLVSQGTVEERVLALHGHKRRLAEAVLSGARTPASLDAEALEALLEEA